ncbi:hypothetical protein BDR03DRAFT_985993 [Suillus americanus]|nr:hypothetical protein BDR03DRAFT_985993 [Suillus americanus]
MGAISLVMRLYLVRAQGDLSLYTGLSNLVERLRQDRGLYNPSFPPPMLGPAGSSTATAMGVRYLPGSTFTSGQPTSESVQAGPSSAPVVQGDLGVSSTVSSPASVTNSLP